MIEDFDRCYRAMLSNDARFNGQIIVGVHSTQIYCVPAARSIRRPAQPPRTSAAVVGQQPASA